MLCDECKKRTASVQITKVINGHKSQMHLCEECAGAVQQHLQINLPQFGIFDLLSGLLPQEASAESTIRNAQLRGLKCPVCEQTYAECIHKGRFGCSACYSAFAEQLNPLLRKIHGAIEHTGKVPQRTGGQMMARKELKKLRDELNLAIIREEYEKAAGLRDKIRALEGSGGE